MNILQLICSDNFIVVNKTLINEFGIEPALLLGELASEAIYWQEHEKTDDGYFYSTVENIESRTSLTAYQQRKALQVLQDKGVISIVSKKGSPPKRFIKIDEDAIVKIFDIQKLKNLTFETEKTSHSKVKKLDTKNKEEKKNTEEKPTYIDIAKSAGFTSVDLLNAMEDFKDMRKKMHKPATDRALVLIMKKVVELSKGDLTVAIQIVNQSIENSWLGVFPLRTNYQSNVRTVKNGFMSMLEQTEVSDFDEDKCNSDFGFITDGISEHSD